MEKEVILIPQQHCNFDRTKRTRPKIETIATIGTPPAFVHLPEGLEEKINQRGLKWMAYEGFRSREDVVDFYSKIDVQIIWRTWKQKLVNPLSTVNAMSYGIPTIAY